jgi:hypothetical protein
VLPRSETAQLSVKEPPGDIGGVGAKMMPCHFFCVFYRNTNLSIDQPFGLARRIATASGTSRRI